MIFRDFEQKIVKIVNESGMSIDAIYFIMKNIMREIEEKYFEYCRIEDAATAQKSNSEAEESAIANNNEEGTN
jgi:hypothetical protein